MPGHWKPCQWSVTNSARVRENPRFPSQPQQSMSNVIVISRASGHLIPYFLLEDLGACPVCKRHRFNRVPGAHREDSLFTPHLNSAFCL